MTDLEWCRSMLPRVSRTFAMGIQMLPHPFEPWVTVGYLLCRVVEVGRVQVHLLPEIGVQPRPQHRPRRALAPPFP